MSGEVRNFRRVKPRCVVVAKNRLVRSIVRKYTWGRKKRCTTSGTPGVAMHTRYPYGQDSACIVLYFDGHLLETDAPLEGSGSSGNDGVLTKKC